MPNCVRDYRVRNQTNATNFWLRRRETWAYPVKMHWAIRKGLLMQRLPPDCLVTKVVCHMRQAHLLPVFGQMARASTNLPMLQVGLERNASEQNYLESDKRNKVLMQALHSSLHVWQGSRPHIRVPLPSTEVYTGLLCQADQRSPSDAQPLGIRVWSRHHVVFGLLVLIRQAKKEGPQLHSRVAGKGQTTWRVGSDERRRIEEKEWWNCVALSDDWDDKLMKMIFCV